ncbi:MAG: hypothetical protein DRJ65_21830 [Acidobacteria bacterium]|nr:MAG: hypothetical protein DRJ65_21830 [Acidobacteriota bacterium]
MSEFDKTHDEPLFMAMNDEGESIVSSVKQARATLGHFATAFSKPQFRKAYFLVKTRFEDQDEPGEFVHIWLLVNDVLGDLLFCSTFEVPEGFGGLEEGQSYVLAEDRIEDWMINEDGRLFGGLSIRLQREALPETDREDFDRHAGISEYVDEMP